MNKNRSTWGKGMLLAGLGLLLLSVTTGCASIYYNGYCKVFGYYLPGCIEPPSEELGLLPGAPPKNPDNLQTPEKVILGKMLFYEPALSDDGTVSCASCHIAAAGFADPRSVSLGIKRRHGDLNAPTVLNAAHQKKGRFFWNGRAPSLEDQAGEPLINPKEMGSQKTLEERINRLKGKKKYEDLFEVAFPGKGISLENVKRAIAAFERTLISKGNSPFDRWVKGKNLSPDAIRGWKVFVDKKCSDCHLPPLFSDEEFFNIGVAHRNPNGAPDDGDRSKVTDDDRDKCKFKTPTLRNVSESAPYMHSGNNQTLDRVIQFYSDDPKDQNPCPETVDIRIKEMGKFEKDEKRYLEAFLLSLTDDVSQRKGANLEEFKHKALAPELPVFEVEPVCRKIGTNC